MDWSPAGDHDAGCVALTRCGMQASASKAFSTSPERTVCSQAWPGRRRRPSSRARERHLLARHLLVGDQAEQVTDAVEARAPLVIRGHDVPGGKLRVRGVKHDVARREYSNHLLREHRSVGLSFHWRSGSAMRASKRRFCSASLTSSQNLTSRMPSSTTYLSNSGQTTRKCWCCASEQKPNTYSTPARLYQLRSKITISPAAGKC